MTDLAHSDWNACRIARWTVAATLLLIPALAMQVSDEWNWGVGDFMFAGVMIVGTALLYEWAAKRSVSWAYKAGVALALSAAFLLVWIDLAVGIVGSEDDPHNVAYFAEVEVALATAFAAGARAAGLARAMFATAGFQLLVTVLACYDGWGRNETPGSAGLLGLNAGFALLWLASAALFRRAAKS